MAENKVEYLLNPDNFQKELPMTQRIEYVIKRDGTKEPFMGIRIVTGKQIGRAHV